MNEWMNDVASKNCDCLFCLFARLHQFSRLRWAQHTFVIERKIIQTNKQWMAFGMCWWIYYDDFFRSAVFSLSHTPHPLISFFCVQHLVTLKIAERLLFSIYFHSKHKYVENLENPHDSFVAPDVTIIITKLPIDLWAQFMSHLCWFPISHRINSAQRCCWHPIQNCCF